MRTEIPVAVLSGGAPVSGASVQINIRSAGAAAVFTTESGGTSAPNPLTTNSNGMVGGWVERGAYDAVITAPGVSYTEPFESAPGKDGAIDTAWLANLCVITSKLADGNVTIAKLATDVLTAMIPISACIPYGGTSDPLGGYFVLADGRLIDRTVYVAYYNTVGHKYNGGADPGSNQVRIRDLRGRTPYGADNMGTAQGAAGRLPNSNRVAGQSGGADVHTLVAGELALHTHPIRDSSGFTAVASNENGVAGSTGHFLRGAATGVELEAKNNTGGGAHNNMPPYDVDNWIVRIK